MERGGYIHQGFKLESPGAPVKYDYEKESKAAIERVGDHMSHLIEWFKEDLPLEDAEGTALQKLVQEKLDKQHTVTPLWSNFRKPNEEGPKFGDPIPLPSETVLCFSENEGWCQAILDAAPTGRLGKRKMIQKPASQHKEKDVTQLFGKAASSYDVLLFGLGLDEPKSNDIFDIIAQQEAVTKVFLNIMLALLKNPSIIGRICVITRATFAEDTATHVKAGLGVITNSHLFGMTNCCRLELDGVPFQYIDTEFDMKPPYWSRGDTQWSRCESQLLPRIASEIFRTSTFGHNNVRILHSGRYVARQLMTKQGYEMSCNQFQCPKKGVIGITGGNGALGLVMAEHLLNKADREGVNGLHIKLLSRSMRISDNNMPRWKAVQVKARQLGIQVDQSRLDVSDIDQVDDFFEAHSPNICGIIHAAGILLDSMLFNLTWDKFQAVFDSKSNAALKIHDALLRYDNPGFQFFWNFSSSAVNGNMGQTNYAGSNSVLDALCRHRVAMQLPATSIQWGAWGEVGMAANMDAAAKAAAGMSGNSPQPPYSNVDGLRGLETGLSTGAPVISCFKWNPALFPYMVEGIEKVDEHYGRNMLEEVFPLPAISDVTFDPKYLYAMNRHLDGPLSGNAEALVKSNIIDPFLGKLKPLDDDFDLIEDARVL